MAIDVDRRVADRDFVYYFLTSPTFRQFIEVSAIQTGVPHINLGLLRDVEVNWPAREEQRRIASILGALDDKIEVNRRMNETLEAMARAIFQDWFVAFGPTRAKMEGRPPYLAPDLWQLFPDRLDAEGKPEGWALRTLADVVSVLETGGRPRGGVSGYREGVPSIGAESIVGLGVFDYSKTKFVPRSFFDGMTKGRVESRDVLLYKDGGRPGEFEPHATLVGDGFPFEECAINEHVYRIRATPAFGQSLLFFALTSEATMAEMRLKGTGVAIPGLNSTQARSLTILVPSQAVAAAFNATTEPLISRILANCNESRTLATTRDLLLPRLMSGELRVKDAERLVETAA
jgi:type I restriction enzyme S subunit